MGNFISKGGTIQMGMHNEIEIIQTTETQRNIALDIPDKPRRNNGVSLDKARGLFSEGKSLLPSFEDFIEMYKYYGEVEFAYKGKR